MWTNLAVAHFLHGHDLAVAPLIISHRFEEVLDTVHGPVASLRMCCRTVDTDEDPKAHGAVDIVA